MRAGVWREDLTVTTSFDLGALLALWDTPPRRRVDAHADFSRFYADPTTINGEPVSVAALVSRAYALHDAFSDQTSELLEGVADDHRLAFAVRRHGTHTGDWATAAGTFAATGERVTITGMDILTIDEGRVTEIRDLADDLAVLMTAAAARSRSSS